MPLSLRLQNTPGVPGMTYHSDNLLGTWAKPTAIYQPPGVDLDKGEVNILIWLHGLYVAHLGDIFTTDRAAVRKQVVSSGKNVLLVAPYLGGGNTDYNVEDMGGSWGQIFLDQVLTTLAVGVDPDVLKEPAPFGSEKLAELAKVPGQSPKLRLGKLVIACHSAGGRAMRNLVDSLGRSYYGRLVECWGFDCMYGVKLKPDTATFWYNFVTGSNGRPLFVSFGKSTVGHSTKLALMGRGLSDSEGARREPPGAAVPKLEVRLGVKSPKSMDELMGLDKLLEATKTGPKGPPPAARKFAEQAGANLYSNTAWPGDEMEMHYAIARDGVLEKLKGAGYL